MSFAALNYEKKIIIMVCRNTIIITFLNTIIVNNFSILNKCNGKLNYLIYEMSFVKKKTSLNKQSEPICAKLVILTKHAH